jgi:hypothetical protein
VRGERESGFPQGRLNFKELRCTILQPSTGWTQGGKKFHWDFYLDPSHSTLRSSLHFYVLYTILTLVRISVLQSSDSLHVYAWLFCISVFLTLQANYGFYFIDWTWIKATKMWFCVSSSANSIIFSDKQIFIENRGLRLLKKWWPRHKRQGLVIFSLTTQHTNTFFIRATAWPRMYFLSCGRRTAAEFTAAAAERRKEKDS